MARMQRLKYFYDCILMIAFVSSCLHLRTPAHYVDSFIASLNFREDN